MLVNEKRTLIIDRDGIIERVSADRTVYAPPPPDATTPSTTPADAIDKETTGPRFLIDELLDHRENDDGTSEFSVKWTGYRTPTWEPRSNIPEELVSRYFAKLRLDADRRLPSYAGPR